MDHPPPITAPEVIQALRTREPVLRRAGITHLSLFGSVARNDAGPESDIDLAAEFDPAAKVDMIRLAGLERELTNLFGRPVRILPEPVRKARLQANIERDRVRAY